ncbi:hypothetical protein TREMEDRAFT_58013 [Tremella mesenterica DSM 1558]|uniref:uncharacterized protein n=1 Tax=Tremella mesenterica (strain ATCC 24925 / CBS 8224 / DSM 1558 / NBRC 9311 / NRRL Y-6157 / RJB 2259-6 / UBC 559-6) TaxID=578456 RepID=UPI0003F49212|nr:uncharacterized protein TREMEDRAFT_58013 [Tremella mesenterica DSM 1558]EIW71888.1 hypothetical protein TREMEDRAFT_58013 [Tremella mesenterica DSM 1558]
MNTATTASGSVPSFNFSDPPWSVKHDPNDMKKVYFCTKATLDYKFLPQDLRQWPGLTSSGLSLETLRTMSQDKYATLRKAYRTTTKHVLEILVGARLKHSANTLSKDVMKMIENKVRIIQAEILKIGTIIEQRLSVLNSGALKEESENLSLKGDMSKFERSEVPSDQLTFRRISQAKEADLQALQLYLASLQTSSVPETTYIPFDSSDKYWDTPTTPPTKSGSASGRKKKPRKKGVKAKASRETHASDEDTATAQSAAEAPLTSTSVGLGFQPITVAQSIDDNPNGFQVVSKSGKHRKSRPGITENKLPILGSEEPALGHIHETPYSLGPSHNEPKCKITQSTTQSITQSTTTVPATTLAHTFSPNDRDTVMRGEDAKAASTSLLFSQTWNGSLLVVSHKGKKLRD